MMNGVGEELVKFIKLHPESEEFDAKLLATRFTMQNVIRCTYSVDAECFEKSHLSEFLVGNRKLFEPSFLVGLKFMAMPILPRWILNLIPIPYVISA